MDVRIPKTIAILAVLLGGLTGCAAQLESAIASPKVELRDVQVMGLGFNSQVFLLSFDISNPNAFSLPVSTVSYGVRLDGQRFASGQTESDFSVPAGGHSQFSISVELDLLQTAPQLLSIVRAGVREDVPYELDGTLGLDIPFAPQVSYRHRGAIRLQSDAF